MLHSVLAELTLLVGCSWLPSLGESVAGFHGSRKRTQDLGSPRNSRVQACPRKQNIVRRAPVMATVVFGHNLTCSKVVFSCLSVYSPNRYDIVGANCSSVSCFDTHSVSDATTLSVRLNIRAGVSRF